MEERHAITVKTEGIEKSAALLTNAINQMDFFKEVPDGC